MKKCRHWCQLNVNCGMIFVFCFIFLLACTKKEPGYPVELENLHSNVLDYYLETSTSKEGISELINKLNEEGAWIDIDYSNQRRGGWPVKSHLEKLLQLSIAYKQESSDFFMQKSLSRKIHLALDYWLDNDFLSPNWWDQHIGVPRLLAPILFLVEEELSQSQYEKALVLLYRAEIKMTGQNKVWLSGNVLYRSLLLRDADSLAIASKAIQEELVLSSAEGIQYDWSYHQHGSQLQMGNYGLSYLEDMTRWYRILNNTPFRYSDDKSEIIRNYILQGQQWVSWKGKFDISVCGRQLFPDEPSRKHQRLKRIVQAMSNMDEKNIDAYSNALDYKSLTGNKHFYRSDYHVHRNPDYFVSVKMCSKRVLGAESVNEENIQGYHMGDGVTLLYQSGKEYENIFPFWNWRRLPGTTLIQDTAVLPRLTAWGYRIESDFVGGLSDGVDGIAVMDYQRDGLSANKSWFMFNNMVVCLGSNINAQTDFPVNTTVNQVFLEGKITASSKGKTKSVRNLKLSSSVDWILHDSLGYYFPHGGNLKLEAKYLEGTWTTVAKRYRPVIYTDELFRLWFDHGSNPKNESYAYFMIPKADKDVMQKLEDDQPFIISNTAHLQSVISSDQSMAGLVFYQAGNSKVFGGIELNEPCVIMLKKERNGVNLSICDPSHKLKEISLKLSGNYEVKNGVYGNGKTSIKVPLPDQKDAGKTVSLFLKHSDSN